MTPMREFKDWELIEGHTSPIENHSKQNEDGGEIVYTGSTRFRP
jgi:hypothetical protein